MFTISLCLHAQQKKDVWECGELNTQAEMNQCAIQSYQRADSVLTNKKVELLAVLDSLIKAQEQKVTSIADEYELAHLKSLQMQQKEVAAIHTSFENMRKAVKSFIAEQYEGGSMQPLVTYGYALELTEGQISLLSKLNNELRQ